MFIGDRVKVKVKRIGTAELIRVGNLFFFLDLPDTNYVPSMRSSLISFSELDNWVNLILDVSF